MLYTFSMGYLSTSTYLVHYYGSLSLLDGTHPNKERKRGDTPTEVDYDRCIMYEVSNLSK